MTAASFGFVLHAPVPIDLLLAARRERGYG
jgi:hypothetical protein